MAPGREIPDATTRPHRRPLLTRTRPEATGDGCPAVGDPADGNFGGLSGSDNRIGMPVEDRYDRTS